MVYHSIAFFTLLLYYYPWYVVSCSDLWNIWGFFYIEQIIAAAKDVQEKKEIYTPYNILPLDAAGASQPIMQLEEVL